MRGLFRFIGLLLAAIIIAALAIFAVENISLVPLRYVGKTFTGNLWWICVGSAVLGFILAFLLLAPGRVAAGWRGRTLGRERMRLQDDLAVVRAREAQLRTEHEHLRAEHAQVAAERDQLRQPGTTTAPAATGMPVPAASERASTNAEPLVPPAQPVETGTVAATGGALERPPTMGERLRGAFGGARQGTYEPPADDTGYPGPTAPAS